MEHPINTIKVDFKVTSMKEYLYPQKMLRVFLKLQTLGKHSNNMQTVDKGIMKRFIKVCLLFLSNFPAIIYSQEATRICALEICSDSSIRTCWDAYDNDDLFQGVFLVDPKTNDVNYEAGFFLFVDPCHFISMDSLFQILVSSRDSLKYKKLNPGAAHFSMLKSRLSYLDSIRSIISNENIMVYRDAKIDEKINKPRLQRYLRSKSIYAGYYLRQDNEIFSSVRTYSYFELEFTYLDLHRTVSREFFNPYSRKKKNMLYTKEIPLYFIVSMGGVSN